MDQNKMEFGSNSELKKITTFEIQTNKPIFNEANQSAIA